MCYDENGNLIGSYNFVQGRTRWIERERLTLGDLPELSVRILDLCRERGRVTVAEAAKVTGASRNTIKDHLKTLTKAGHLVQHGAGRGTWYGLS